MDLARVPRISTARQPIDRRSPVRPIRALVLEQYAAHFDRNGLAKTGTGRVIALQMMQQALNSFLENLLTPFWSCSTNRQINVRVVGYCGGVREGRARLGIYRPEGEDYHKALSLQKSKRSTEVFGEERARQAYARPSDIDLTIDYDGQIDFALPERVKKIAASIFEHYGILIDFALLTNYRNSGSFPETQSPIAELAGNGLRERLLPLV